MSHRNVTKIHIWSFWFSVANNSLISLALGILKEEVSYKCKGWWNKIKHSSLSIFSEMWIFSRCSFSYFHTEKAGNKFVYSCYPRNSKRVSLHVEMWFIFNSYLYKSKWCDKHASELICYQHFINYYLESPSPWCCRSLHSVIHVWKLTGSHIRQGSMGLLPDR